MKKQSIILIVILLAVFLIGAAGFAITGYWLPYHRAVSSFAADQSIVMYQQNDGSVLLQWPEGENADQYLLEVLIPGQDEAEYSCYVSSDTSHMLPKLSTDSPRTIRIQTVAQYRFPFAKEPRLRLGQNPIEVTGTFVPPQIRDVQWNPDPDADVVNVTLDLDSGCTARLYTLSDGSAPQPEATFAGNQTVLYFGDGKTWPVPAYGEEFSFAFDAYCKKEGYTFYGLMTEPVSLVREDLLGTVLDLSASGATNNQYTLTWNETKGDYYLVQHRLSEKQEWKTLMQIPANGDRTFITNSLDPYSYQEYRVIARKTEDTEDHEPIAQSEIIPVQTGSAVIYSTVWPIKALDVYTDAQKSATIGTAKEGTAFCVLDLENGLFRVRYQDGYGYIDSNYCLINLSEFLGGLCLYDITNSYESLYKIHEYDIPTVTGETIIGYEKIRLGEDQYLVPLLFPTALKLEQAALSAAEDGYALKIYDSFRPQAATFALYEQAYDFSQEAIPEDELPEDYTPPETEPTEPGEPEATLPPYTYAQYMTDNERYTLNYFLAKGRSRHNQGVAMDMTLVSSSGELPMQTDMHDLSWYSETKQNGKNANTLASIMKNAGFAGLVSEWWHFQDDENVKALDVPALWNGVTPECWMADEYGWRYRRANGRYYTDCSATIDGVVYHFDQNGYVID